MSQAASCCNSFIINLLLSNPDSTLWTGEESARFEGAEVGSFIPSIDRSINQAVSPAESIFTCPFCVKKGYNQLIDANLSFNDNNCPSLSLQLVSLYTSSGRRRRKPASRRKIQLFLLQQIMVVTTFFHSKREEKPFQRRFRRSIHESNHLILSIHSSKFTTKSCELIERE